MYTKVLNKLIPARIMTDDDYFPKPPFDEFVIDFVYNTRPKMTGAWAQVYTIKINDYKTYNTLLKLKDRIYNHRQFYIGTDGGSVGTDVWPACCRTFSDYGGTNPAVTFKAPGDVTAPYITATDPLASKPLEQWLTYNPLNQHFIMYCGFCLDGWSADAERRTAVLHNMTDAVDITGFLPYKYDSGYPAFQMDIFSMAYVPKVWNGSAFVNYFNDYEFLYDDDRYLKAKQISTGRLFKVSKTPSATGLLTFDNTYNSGEMSQGAKITDFTWSDNKYHIYLFDDTQPIPPEKITIDFIHNCHPYSKQGWRFLFSATINDFASYSSLLKLKDRSYSPAKFEYTHDDADVCADAAYHANTPSYKNNYILKHAMPNDDNVYIKTGDEKETAMLHTWLQYNPLNQHYICLLGYKKQTSQPAATSVLTQYRFLDSTGALLNTLEGYFPENVATGSPAGSPDFYSLPYVGAIWTGTNYELPLAGYQYMYDTDGYLKIRNITTGKKYKLSRSTNSAGLLSLSRTYNGTTAIAINNLLTRSSGAYQIYVFDDDQPVPKPPETEIVVDMLWNYRPNLDGSWGVYSTTKITNYQTNDTLVKLVNKTFDSSRFYYKIDNPDEYYPVNAYRADNYTDAYRILENCTANNLTKMYLDNDNCTLKDVPLTEWLQYNPANGHYVMCGAFTKEWGNISGCETAVLVLPNGDKVDGYLPTGGGGDWTLGPDFYSLAFAPTVYMSGSVGRREYFENYKFFYDANGYFKVKNTLTNKTYKIAKDAAGSTLLTISNTYNGVVGQKNRGPVVSSVLTNKVDGKRAFYLFEEV